MMSIALRSKLEDYFESTSSRNSSLTSMDTEKMERLNLEADKEQLDTDLIHEKKQRGKLKHMRLIATKTKPKKFAIVLNPLF